VVGKRDLSPRSGFELMDFAITSENCKLALVNRVI